MKNSNVRKIMKWKVKWSEFEVQGDMDTILDSVLCPTIEADQRVREIITELISENQLTEFDAFVNKTADKTAARKHKAQKEEA